MTLMPHPPQEDIKPMKPMIATDSVRSSATSVDADVGFLWLHWPRWSEIEWMKDES